MTSGDHRSATGPRRSRSATAPSGSPTASTAPSPASIRAGTPSRRRSRSGRARRRCSRRDGAIWVADSYAGRVVRVDPARTASWSDQRGQRPRSILRERTAEPRGDRRPHLAERTRDHRRSPRRHPPSVRHRTSRLARRAARVRRRAHGRCSRSRATGSSGSSAWAASTAARSFPTSRRRCPCPRTAAAPTPSSSGGASATRTAIRVRASDVRRGLERMVPPRLRGALVLHRARRRRRVLEDALRPLSRCRHRRPHGHRDPAPAQARPELFYKLALPFADPVPPGVPMAKPARLGVPGNRAVHDPEPRPEAARARAQPALPRVVRRRAARRLSRPDRLDVRQRARHAVDRRSSTGRPTSCSHRCRPSRRNELTTRYAALVHVFPASATFALFLNTRVPPFDNLQARQAVNFAIDRGQRPRGSSTEPRAPTGSAVSRGRCRRARSFRPESSATGRTVPTRGTRRAAGVWTGPDLARAQRLVTASGTRGEKVVFWTAEAAPARRREAGRRNAAAARIPGDAEDVHERRPLLREDRRLAHARAGRLLRLVAGLSRRVELPLALHLQRVPARGHEQRQRRRLCDRAHRPRRRSRARAADRRRRVDRDMGRGRPPGDRPRSRGCRSSTRARSWSSPRASSNVQSNPQWGVLFDQIWVR